MKLSPFSRPFGVTSCLILFAVLAGCTSTDDLSDHAPPAPSSEPIALSTYAAMIGDASFQRARTEQFATGYSVESGNLLGRDNSVGTLILVRSPSGEVTGVVDRVGRQGTFHVGVNGSQHFTQAQPVDYMKMNDVVAPASPEVAPTQSTQTSSYVDVLAGYSRYALEKIAEDPIAYAYAMLESVNQNIDNSSAGAMKLRLAGVRIHEVDYNTSGEGLRKWDNLLAPLRRHYSNDVIMAFAGWSGGTAGMAYVPGMTSVSAWGAPTAFRHEFAHNVGAVTATAMGGITIGLVSTTVHQAQHCVATACPTTRHPQSLIRADVRWETAKPPTWRDCFEKERLQWQVIRRSLRGNV